MAHKPTPQDINALFNRAPVVNIFAFTPKIPTQLKHILKADPDYEVVYVKGVPPKKPNIRELMRKSGIPTSLRGVGWTRKNKEQSKNKRKMSQASRKRNRR